MTTDTKISQLYSVNELGEGGPVEVWLYKGRIVIRAYNCSGNEHTNIDLEHLMDCLNQWGWERAAFDGRTPSGS
jgi:hypothetical protein